jgi:hypothetical protein
MLLIPKQIWVVGMKGDCVEGCLGFTVSGRFAYPKFGEVMPEILLTGYMKRLGSKTRD